MNRNKIWTMLNRTSHEQNLHCSQTVTRRDETETPPSIPTVSVKIVKLLTKTIFNKNNFLSL